MNIIKLARHSLGLSQTAFGAWLGKELNHTPYSKGEVSRWENGHISPRQDIRQAVAWIAAKEIAKQVHGLTVKQSTEIIAESLGG